jgi:hypothetical protein
MTLALAVLLSIAPPLTWHWGGSAYCHPVNQQTQTLFVSFYIGRPVPDNQWCFELLPSNQLKVTRLARPGVQAVYNPTASGPAQWTFSTQASFPVGWPGGTVTVTQP